MENGRQLKLLALLSTVLSVSWKEGEQSKLCSWSLPRINSLWSSFSWIDLLPPLYKGWSCSVLPIEVSCRGFITASSMSLSNIGLSKKTQTWTAMFLQEKLDAAFNRIWESLTKNTISLLSSWRITKFFHYRSLRLIFITRKQFSQEIPDTDQLTVVIMLLKSDIFCMFRKCNLSWNPTWDRLLKGPRLKEKLQPRTKLLREIRLYSSINATTGHHERCGNCPPSKPHTMLFWPCIQILLSLKHYWKRGEGRTDTYSVVCKVSLKAIEKYRRVFNLFQVV